ncbi:MAG: PAS domain S-box protein [Elusimicrobiota bacterium]
MSDERYRILFDVASDMILLLDPMSGEVVDANPTAVRLLGYSRDELLRTSFFSLLASDAELADTRRVLEQALKTGAGTRVSVFRTKSGGLLEAEIRNTPLPLEERALMLGIGRDLTAQRQLERRALAFYQAFLNSNDYMFYTDRNGLILDVNEAFIRRFGYAREEAVGRTPKIVRSAHTTPELYKRLWSDILDPARGFWRGRIINRTKGGDEVPVMLSATAVRDSRGEIVGFVSSAVDMSEHEELQRRLAQSESLAAVGTMAAVVAHEIRNPLASIVTAASSLAREGLSYKERETLLTVLRKESLRLTETLNQFLQYARPREVKLEQANLNDLVQEVLAMIRADPKLQGSVRISEELSPGLLSFRFDADAVRQVLWNIILNALEAMKGKGRLNVATEAKDGSALVHVTDSGPGIPKKQLSKIFQPFHTTKRQGTGLGLPVADRIVAAHGGRILVETQPGLGAKFSIQLPLRQEAP